MPNSDKTKDDEKARKAVAQSIRRQIEDLKSGRRRPGAPANLRDWVQEKMAADPQKK